MEKEKMKTKHHLFTKRDVRAKLIEIMGAPKTDIEHTYLSQEVKWAWGMMPKYKIDDVRHRLIHSKKANSVPSKDLIELRKDFNKNLVLNQDVNKIVSTFQKKVNKIQLNCTRLMMKNLRRLDTAKRNHLFCQVLKDNFPDIYKEVVKLYKKKYPELNKKIRRKKHVKSLL